MSDPALEYEHCGFFDSLSQHRMQAGARHDVGRLAENPARQGLDVHQLVEAELPPRVIEEKIDIRIAPCLARAVEPNI